MALVAALAGLDLDFAGAPVARVRGGARFRL